MMTICVMGNIDYDTLNELQHDFQHLLRIKKF
jgi:hypothetical protein